MDLHAIICKVPVRVLGPSFAKIQDKMTDHDENSRQRKKEDQIVFSPKLVLLDQALSKQDPANLLENELRNCTTNIKRAPLS
jgi:hypothetical protein